MEHLIKPKRDSNVLIEVTPHSAGWRCLSFKVLSLKAGQHYSEPTGENEVALVPLTGGGIFNASGEHFEIGRKGIFVELPQVLYVPPGKEIRVTAHTDFEFAMGGAPAEGKYPTRLFTPVEMKQEMRGGSAARRQVNHLLAHPLPAERLILYEVYVPGGAWSGWPPHCHDGYLGSPYLEEVYYYRIDPEEGFAVHRNYRRDTDFDELFAVQNGELVLVTQGFHPAAAAPGSNVYFLNYLAGELLDEARATPPLDDAAYAWIKDNWEKNLLRLPMGDK